MGMNILFHLDPHDNNEEMLGHRIEQFAGMVKALRQDGHHCCLYAASDVAALVDGTSLFDAVIHSKLNPRHWPYKGVYHSLAYANHLDPAMEVEAKREYAGFQAKFHGVVTNTPSALLKKACPSLPILHYELGLFSRQPFPLMHQFDPWGYSHRSLLAAFPSLGQTATPMENELVGQLRENAMNMVSLRNKDIGADDVVYMPLQSEGNWTVRLESSLSRIDQIRQARDRFQGRTLRISEKLRHPLTEEERSAIANMPSVELLATKNLLSEGSFQVARCRTVFTSSPSLALQTIFWGNELIVPEGASMQLWAGNGERRRHELAAYLCRYNGWSMEHAAKLIPQGFEAQRQSRSISRGSNLAPSSTSSEPVVGAADSHVSNSQTANPLITDRYLELQETLHRNPEYGRASELFAPLVRQLIEGLPITSLSDYGAGKRRLWSAIKSPQHIDYRPYDPVFPEYGPARSADLTCCIDVLEHVEPECLESVLDDLERITPKFGFFTIHLGPAKKVLADGRNAHLIQKPADWWTEKLEARFEILALEQHQIHGNGFWTLVQPKSKASASPRRGLTC